MKFIPVRTMTIRGNQPLIFNLYLKIRDHEVLYIRRNEAIEEKRLKRLFDRKIKKVYIEASSELKYLHYLEQNLKKAADKSIPIDERSSIVEGQSRAITQDIFENPQDRDIYNSGKAIVEKYVSFLSDNEMAMGYLVNLKSDDFDSYQHAINVSALAIGLANRRKEKNRVTLENLAMGALLHDIGKTKLEIDPSKPTENYTEKEMEDLKKHPTIGAQLLNEGNFIDGEIIRHVLHHEEHINGSGYPGGLRGSQISPLTHYISLANIYDRYITFYKITPEEAMKRITIDKVGFFDLEQIENLKNLLIDQGVLK